MLKKLLFWVYVSCFCVSVNDVTAHQLKKNWGTGQERMVSERMEHLSVCVCVWYSTRRVLLLYCISDQFPINKHSSVCQWKADRFLMLDIRKRSLGFLVSSLWKLIFVVHWKCALRSMTWTKVTNFRTVDLSDLTNQNRFGLKHHWLISSLGLENSIPNPKLCALMIYFIVNSGCRLPQCQRTHPS